MAIKRVWLEEGCTLCGICEDGCPEVFELGEETSQVKGDADLAANEKCIRQAVEECPVEVIKFEED